MKRKNGLIPLLLVSFLLGIHDGKIAIWKNEDPQPRYILPYRAKLLPPDDRKQLAKGIHIDSEEDLMHFIEDFCS